MTIATATRRRDEDWYLRLYVAGQSPKSLRAFANLKTLCEEHLAGRYEIEVIDLVEHPALAPQRRHPRHPHARPPPPRPLRKIIGDLSNTERVLVGLGSSCPAPSPMTADRDGRATS